MLPKKYYEYKLTTTNLGNINKKEVTPRKYFIYHFTK